MNNLSAKQIQILERLANNKSHSGHHAKDSFDRRSLQPLIQKGLVKEYHFRLFLHGAVRITEEGKQVLQTINK